MPPPVGFFLPITPQIPRVAERRPASHGTPADELICVTSADHPANFNCELNLAGHRRTSARWVLYRRITTGFLQDLMQKSPHGDLTMDLSLLGRQLNSNLQIHLLDYLQNTQHNHPVSLPTIVTRVCNNVHSHSNPHIIAHLRLRYTQVFPHFTPLRLKWSLNHTAEPFTVVMSTVQCVKDHE